MPSPTNTNLRDSCANQKIDREGMAAPWGNLPRRFKPDGAFVLTALWLFAARWYIACSSGHQSEREPFSRILKSDNVGVSRAHAHNQGGIPCP